MNRNFLIAAAVVVIIVAALSMMRGSGEDVTTEGTEPAAETD